jgi:hypothetical protein
MVADFIMERNGNLSSKIKLPNNYMKFLVSNGTMEK